MRRAPSSRLARHGADDGWARTARPRRALHAEAQRQSAATAWIFISLAARNAMPDTLFDIVFSGQFVSGVDPAQAKAGLARLFKIDDARVEALCTTRTVIKKGVDEATARNYASALAKVGARVELVPSGGAPAAPATATPATPAPVARPVASAPVNTPAAAPVPVAPAMTVAEPGALLTEPSVVTPPEFDLSGMTLAAVGTLLVEPSTATPPEFDLSGLQLAPAGTVLDERPPPPPADIDTSSLSLSQP